jgi:RHS repeat-associated protein
MPNTLNQYSAVGAVTPTYDGNGNLTYDGSFTYGYDAESRLTGITQGASSIASYAWDAQGRRKLRTVGAAKTTYVTDADNREMLEYDGTTGALQAWHAFGLGPDDALNRMNIAGSSRQTLIPDIQGSVIGTLDSSGTLTRAGYQPFGENASLTTAGFRYTGRRLDPETGGSAAEPSGLYYYRARMYSPTWGRFLQPDSRGYSAGANLYAYGNNDPLGFTDPLGLAPDGPQWNSGGSLVRDLVNQGVSVNAGNLTPASTLSIPSWAWKTAGAEEILGGGPEDPLADFAAGVTLGIGLGSVILHNEEQKSPEIDPGEVAGKSPQEIDQIAKEKGLVPKGPDPMNGKGAYVDPVTGEQRILVHPGANGHVHVNDPSGQRLGINGKPVAPESPLAHLPIGH